MVFDYSILVAQTTAPVVKVQPNEAWCLGCICEGISNCNRSLRCEGDVCGLFRITWAYWADAGKFTVNNEDANSKTGTCISVVKFPENFHYDISSR